MSNIIVKLVLGQKLTEKEIQDTLYEICDSVHSSCGRECPVFALNGGPVNPQKSFEENRGCDCFKSGKAMAEFIGTFATAEIS